MPGWLSRLHIPLFVSHRRLRPYKTLPVANAAWSLDSGGFTELSQHGRWTVTAQEYVAAVRRYANEIGNLQWAAPQDAMCEPWVLAKSRSWLGGTVEAHQRWTVDNYMQLRTLANDLPIVPVVQGWQLDDYTRHVDQYAAAGVDLTQVPVVGLGSVCRRQATSEIVAIVQRLSALGLRLHGFGVKTTGVAQYGNLLHSADSMAWSFGGRYVRPCPVDGKASCAHCVHHALAWRNQVLTKLNVATSTPDDIRYEQGTLFCVPSTTTGGTQQ